MLKNDVNFILWKFVGPIICEDVGKMGEASLLPLTQER